MKKENTKNIIIGLSVVALLIVILVIGLASSDNTSSNNTNDEKAETYKVWKSFRLAESSTRTATITFYTNNKCQVDFTNFNGSVKLFGSKDIVYYKYPTIDEPCSYSKKDNIISVFYGGLVEKTIKYQLGTGSYQEASQGIKPIMYGIEFKYNEKEEILEINNGRWNVSLDENGLGLIYFIKDGSKEDIEEKEMQAEEQRKKEEADQQDKEEKEERNRKNIDTILVSISYSPSSKEKVVIDVYNNAIERIIKSFKINGKEYPIEGGSNTYEFNAKVGLNIYEIVIENIDGYIRKETKEYTFEPIIPYVNIDDWTVSCYLNIWSYEEDYNDLDKLEIYYDGVPIKSSPLIVGNLTITSNEIKGMYSKSGTHTLKFRNKYGLEYEKKFTFPNNCG